MQKEKQTGANTETWCYYCSSKMKLWLG